MESMPAPPGASFLRAASEYSGEEYDLGDGRRGSIIEIEMMPDIEAWPRGIIKTVSVEVVEEVNPDHVPHAGGSSTAAKETNGGDHRNSSGSAVEQDWEAMLRAGPPGPVR